MNFYNILSSSKQLNNHTSFYDILFSRRLSSRVSQYLWYKLWGNTVQSGTPTPSNPVEVNGVGERTKNLLEMQAVTRTRRGITFTINADKSVTVTGTATGLTYSILMGGGASTNNLNDYSTPIFKAGDSLIFTTGAPVSLQARYTDGTYSNSIPNNQAITLKKDVGLIYTQVSSSETIDYTIYPMIRLSTVSSTDYEPYGYKIPINCDSKIKNIYLNEPLHKINDYADILSYQDHNVVRKIKKRVFDGTENWSEGASSKSYRFAIKIGDATQSDLTVGVRSICTHFPLVATGQTFTVDNCYTIASDKSFVCRLDGSVRLADFKSYLQQQYANGTPVTIWYVLANEETEQIKAPDILVDKYTSITVDTEVQPSQVDFSTKGKKVPQPSAETVRMLNSANTANQVNMLNQNEELMTSEAEPSDYLSEETKTELEEPIEKEQTKEVEPIEKEEIEVEPIEKEQSKAELEEPIEKEQTDFIIK